MLLRLGDAAGATLLHSHGTALARPPLELERVLGGFSNANHRAVDLYAQFHGWTAWRLLSTSSLRQASTQTPAVGDTIHVTDACAQRLRQLASEAGAPAVLRVAVEGGGCSGYQYRFELDSAVATDRVFENGGAWVAVDPVSYAFLKGATVDFSEELIRTSFTVKDNPNTEASCGCGTSFAAK